MPKREEIIRRLVKQLDLAHDTRTSLNKEPDIAARRELLRQWQAERLARTHADLLASRQYGATAAFFLTDIYGPRDLSRHEADVRRILPIMTRVLPATGLETVANAIELNALSELLDAKMVRALGSKADNITSAGYADAYRQVGCRPERERQIALISDIGRCLEQLTTNRFIGTALSTMRRPARLAGLGELQDFLERGYKAFREMGSADEFLQLIVTRERNLMEALFASDHRLLPV